MLPHPDIITPFLGARLPNRSGLHALVAAHLRQLATFPAGHPGAAAVGAITLDLVTALLTYEVDTPRALPPESQQRALLARIDRFIDERLRDPALSPTTIAAAHYISVRYLHKLFHTREETVAGHIRRRRLRRCHADLADPRQATRPVRAIATSWGFTDSAHFSRLFKSEYGISASDHRHRSLRQPEPPRP